MNVKTPFRIDVSQMRRKLAALKAIPARIFKPEIQNNLLRPALNAAKKNTPVRDLDLIRNNQIEKPGNQYERWQERGGNHGITKAQFLADRAPARFLFQLSWVQVGYSLGVNVTASAQVLAATTRNHNDPEPPKGYGQWRGGEVKLSAVIFNPFLAGPPRPYKPFDGAEIIGDAVRQQKPVFLRAVDRKLKRAIYAIMHS